jgi:hypothetical protein
MYINTAKGGHSVIWKRSIPENAIFIEDIHTINPRRIKIYFTQIPKILDPRPKSAMSIANSSPFNKTVQGHRIAWIRSFGANKNPELE